MKKDVLRAIRYMCSECMGYQPSEIDKCTSKTCPLYPFRFSKDPSPSEPMEAYSQDVYTWTKMREIQKEKEGKGTDSV